MLINGVPRSTIQHGKGLRQGDPLSPLLFVIAIDPLVKLLDLATQNGRLAPLRKRQAHLRVSLYADDAAVFLTPRWEWEDVSTLREILHRFGMVTGLVTNLEKSAVAATRCTGINLQHVLEDFPATRATFPFKYLSLPLTLVRLQKIDCQPLIDKAASSLAH